MDKQTKVDLANVKKHNRIVNLRGHARYNFHRCQLTKNWSITLITLVAIITIVSRLFLVGIGIMLVILIAGYGLINVFNRRFVTAKQKLGPHYRSIRTL